MYKLIEAGGKNYIVTKFSQNLTKNTLKKRNIKNTNFFFIYLNALFSDTEERN